MEDLERLHSKRRTSRSDKVGFSGSLLLFLFLCLVRQSNTFCPSPRLTSALHNNYDKSVIKPIPRVFEAPVAFVRNQVVLGAKGKAAVDDDDEEDDDEEEDEEDDDEAEVEDDNDDDDVDIPGDWNEADVLAEFDDVDITEENDTDDDDEEEDIADVVVAEDDEDDLDDEDEIDEIDLDDEEDEEEDDEGIEEIILTDDAQVEYDEEDEYEYAMTTEIDDPDWDEEDGDYHELEDDDDPNYMKQKELADIAAEKAYERAQDEAFDPINFMMNDMTEEQHAAMQQSELFKKVQERMKGMELTEVDLGDVDIEQAVAEVPDLMADDPYPRHKDGEPNIVTRSTGLTDDDLEEFDQAYKKADERVNEEPWDKVMLKDLTGWDNISNETIEEMEDCLDEIGGSSYNVTRWLLYDLDFNVSNLILAAMKHNREAPILFQHWYPQLVTYKRYQDVRDRNYDFTWDDVENADIGELERYYAGFGYDEIPKKAPVDTGIISLEDLDEDEIKMAAFENWVKEVYNPEWDRKDFDDDDMQDEDNVFSHFYEAPQHPDKPTFEDSLEDIEMWNEEMGDDDTLSEYREMMGKAYEYEVVKDEEFEREFRGHLVIACTGEDSDLDIAEKITIRFEKEFGKQVFVETRILQLAREEDNVFEIWLESYEVDLLHSKKRATSNAKGWNGPEVCDDAQIDYLVGRVRFLISDDARYSYRMEDLELAE